MAYITISHKGRCATEFKNIVMSPVTLKGIDALTLQSLDHDAAEIDLKSIAEIGAFFDRHQDVRAIVFEADVSLYALMRTRHFSSLDEGRPALCANAVVSIPEARIR